MGGYQFIHLETFGTSIAKAKTATAARKKMPASVPRTAREIIDEARRSPGSCPHVPQPKPPIEHFSTIPLRRLADEIDQRKNASKDILKRNIRKDALCMVGGVASYPTPIAEMQEQDWTRFEDFLSRSLKFLQRKFGKALVNITVHLDEKFPHFHFYVIPEAGAGLFTLIGLHPGITAKERIGKAKKGGSAELTKARNIAYIEAMRGFQDDFFNEVAQFFEMQRFGPKRSRMSRGEWKALQHQVKTEGLTGLVAENELLKTELAELRAQLAEVASDAPKLPFTN